MQDAGIRYTAVGRDREFDEHRASDIGSLRCFGPDGSHVMNSPAGTWRWLPDCWERAVSVSKRRQFGGAPSHIQDGLVSGIAASQSTVLPNLRSAFDVRDSSQCRWCRRRVGDAAPSARGREGVQEVLADEIANETRSVGEDAPDR